MINMNSSQTTILQFWSTINDTLGLIVYILLKQSMIRCLGHDVCYLGLVTIGQGLQTEAEAQKQGKLFAFLLAQEAALAADKRGDSRAINPRPKVEDKRAKRACSRSDKRGSEASDKRAARNPQHRGDGGIHERCSLEELPITATPTTIMVNPASFSGETESFRNTTDRIVTHT